MEKKLLIILILILILLNLSIVKEKFSNNNTTIDKITNKTNILNEKINNLPFLALDKNKETLNSLINESLFKNYHSSYESIINLGIICKDILDGRNLNILGNAKVYGKLIIEKDIPNVGLIANLETVFSEQNNLLEKLKLQSNYVQGINLENRNLFYFYKMFPNQLRLSDYIFIFKEDVGYTLNKKFRIGIEESDSYELGRMLFYSYDKENFNKGNYKNSRDLLGWSSKLPGPYLKNYRVKSIDLNIKDTKKEEYLWTPVLDFNKDIETKMILSDNNSYIMISLKPKGSSNYVYFGPIYFDSIINGYKTPIFKWIDFSYNWINLYSILKTEEQIFGKNKNNITLI